MIQHSHNLNVMTTHNREWFELGRFAPLYENHDANKPHTLVGITPFVSE